MLGPFVGSAVAAGTSAAGILHRLGSGATRRPPSPSPTSCRSMSASGGGGEIAERAAVEQVVGRRRAGLHLGDLVAGAIEADADVVHRRADARHGLVRPHLRSGCRVGRLDRLLLDPEGRDLLGEPALPLLELLGLLLQRRVLLLKLRDLTLQEGRDVPERRGRDPRAPDSSPPGPDRRDGGSGRPSPDPAARSASSQWRPRRAPAGPAAAASPAGRSCRRAVSRGSSILSRAREVLLRKMVRIRSVLSLIAGSPLSRRSRRVRRVRGVPASRPATPRSRGPRRRAARRARRPWARRVRMRRPRAGDAPVR